VDFTRDHEFAARDAFRRFGQAQHALNFGDCMAYAVAKLADAPLLYKDQDFALTDIRPAL
jgi:ribonuclease VapC